METYNANFRDALIIIAQDFGLTDAVIKRRPRKPFIECYNAESKTFLEAYYEDMSDDDLNYWAQFGIGIRTLNKYAVFKCSSVSINIVKRWISVPSNPIYCYLHPTGHMKIYRPKAVDKKKKFRSNSLMDDL